MIFTPEELQRLFNIIDFRFAKIAADVLGDKVLSKQDILLLDKYAPKWRNELKKFPPYYQSYLFGRLSGVLSKKQLDSLSYKDFEGYLTKMQFEKPTKLDMAAYDISLKKTYSYLKGIGDRVKAQLASSVSNQEMQILVEKQRQKDLETIKEELSRGVLEKKSVPQIVSDIGHKLDEWQHDWGRVVETEMQNIYELGAAQRIAKEHGVDAKVYKTVYGGACNFCIRFYTTNGIGSKPRIFKLADLMANGTNVGRKQKDWLPTVGPVHPFCYDDKTEVLTDKGFKLFKDLDKTEEFLSVNLETGNAEWTRAVGWIDQEYEGLMIYRFGEDLDLATTPNHNHVIWKDEKITIERNPTSEDSFISYKEDSLEKISDYVILKEKYVGRIYDVELEKNHTLIVRRNGKVCVSGNCRCVLNYLPDDYVWSDERQRFEMKPYKRKIERRSKVTITVGDKKFEV